VIGPFQVSLTPGVRNSVMATPSADAGGAAAPTEHRPALVSIGIPTFNRLACLRKSVAAVLAQDYPNIELILSDNASTDGTREFCTALAAGDRRIVYFRQETNVGMVRNFRRAAELATGAFYVSATDDDYMDPRYVSACMRALTTEPDLVAACGSWVLCRDDETIARGAIRVCDDDPRTRVLSYLRNVSFNVAFFAVVRRSVLERLPPMPTSFAGDWLRVSQIAFLGRIRSLDDVVVRISTGGASRTPRNQARVLGLSKLVGLFPKTTMVLDTVRDIGWTCPVYASLGRRRRIAFALHAGLVLANRFRPSPVRAFRRFRSRTPS